MAERFVARGEEGHLLQAGHGFEEIRRIVGYQLVELVQRAVLFLLPKWVGETQTKNNETISTQLMYCCVKETRKKAMKVE